MTLEIRAMEEACDERSWPADALRLIGDVGCWRKAVAPALGGDGSTAAARLSFYEAVASGSLTLALILTQHDAACELLCDCDNRALSGSLLPRCARGEVLNTVGISQLTTSRQGGKPAMAAEKTGDGFRLTGVMPWVTSGRKADYVVTGAVLKDGMQVLACVPTDVAGLTVREPLQLMALGASWTSRIDCDGVRVTREHLMRGPAERALVRRAPVKPLTVSAVGIGVAGALLDSVRGLHGSVPDLGDLFDHTILLSYDATRQRLFDAADLLGDPDAEIPAMAIRASVNDLIVRLAATLLTLAKGSAYVAGHPVGRLVREAMFFLVWSAPPHVQAGTIRRLWS